MIDAIRLDAVALALAASSQPARAAAVLKAGIPSWPVLPLADSLDCLRIDGPAASSRARASAMRVLAGADAAGYQVVWPAHPDYPVHLATIVDPPLLLWVRGDPALLGEPAVALVGARRATQAGREVAFHLAAELAAAGVVVASGFARGIDAAAHRGALSVGRSLAVLGCGLDQPYPSDHGPLACELAARGALVSEFPPGTPPLAHHFPLRNRTLSGLCHAVVVVQATERSGSLITARMALEQGREVMAVPGDVRTDANAGGHALLRDGARLVVRAADVLEELGWTRGPAPPASADRPSRTEARSGGGGRDGSVRAIVAREDGVTLDDLLEETGRNSSDLLAELLDLELGGLVRRDGAGRFLPAERKW